LGYKTNQFAWTTISQQATAGAVNVMIEPASGSYPGMAQARGYQVRLHSTFPPQAVTFNGRTIPYSRQGSGSTWHYEGNTLTSVISLPETSVHQRAQIHVAFNSGQAANQALLDGVPGKIMRLKTTMDILNGSWPKDWSPDELTAAVQTGNRIEVDPSHAESELEQLKRDLPQVIEKIRAMQIDPSLIARALPHLQGIVPGASAAAASK